MRNDREIVQSHGHHLVSPNVQDQPPARSERARNQFTALEADELIRLPLAGRLQRIVRHMMLNVFKDQIHNPAAACVRA